jgi:cyclic beta-1,2-glucan synthetase
MGRRRSESAPSEARSAERPSGRSPRGGLPLARRFKEEEKRLRQAYVSLTRAAKEQIVLPYAAEWLLDNFYVVERASRQIREDLPLRYHRELPVAEEGPLRGYPRVYAIAVAIVGEGRQPLDIEHVKRYVLEYQQRQPLTTGELWALPAMLRWRVIENINRVAAEILELEGGGSGDEEPPLHESAHTAIISNCIGSLRVLAREDWRDVFEALSPVDRLLRDDPAEVYSQMDFETRNRYRNVVEGLARAVDMSEEAVALQAIRLADEYCRAGSQCDYPLASGTAPDRPSHVGYYLVDEGRSQLESRLGYRPRLREIPIRVALRHPLLTYLGGAGTLTALIVAALSYYAFRSGGSPWQVVLAAALTGLPASAVAISWMNTLITRCVPPKPLPRLDFEEGLPPDCRTMLVIPALIGSKQDVHWLLRQIETHYLINEDKYLHCALLTDFGDAPRRKMPEDELVLQAARSGINELNRRYGSNGTGPFYLFHRARLWNPSEGCWMGWERKRGKLVEFNRLLLGRGETSFVEKVGDLSVVGEVKYIITLDADTALMRVGARRLVGTIAHPLNQARFDPETGEVVAGYTVLQPRVEIKPSSANRSLFARIYSGDTGVDLYSRAVSDVYQDFFGEGIFAGKGIYDVAAFEGALEGRVPENALLSHDLFEGIHGRAGLVSEVVLYEDYPPAYLAHAHRLHRWVRGDWQLLPWLLPKVPSADGSRRPNTLSLLDRWKIFDNLRRSLVLPSVLVLLLAGWTVLPGASVVWTVVGIATPAMPLMGAFLSGVLSRLIGRRAISGLSLWTDASRWLLGLAFLLYEALIMIDAAMCTLHRLLITHKRLLQWTTSAHTVRVFRRKGRVGLVWRHMWSASLITLMLGEAVAYLRPRALFVALPILLGWLISPYIAYRIGRPVERKRQGLLDGERQQLRCLARRTWLYFERFMGPEDRWLPPDHFQELPLGLVAHRVSPTNIGLGLLSALAAYDLGYIGPMNLSLRLRASFETIGRMEKHRGHLLNWYDTQSLAPLPPRYVSSVDSGNLAACLVALAHGCRTIGEKPILRQERLQGLIDTLLVLDETVMEADVTGVRAELRAWRALMEKASELTPPAAADSSSGLELLDWLAGEGWLEGERILRAIVESAPERLAAETLGNLHVWMERARSQIQSLRDEVGLLLPWIAARQDVPSLLSGEDAQPEAAARWRKLLDALPLGLSLAETGGVCRSAQCELAEISQLLARVSGAAEEVEAARSWCDGLSTDLESARMAAEVMLYSYRDLAGQAETLFEGMDFGFLYDDRTGLLRIGYNLDAGRLDPYYYDLIASEARIASLVAIAKGDVPQSHWLHLGRPLTQVGRARALLSWNGSMFEYLMPLLLIRSYEGTLLDQSAQVAVKRQIAYGKERRVPWGMSESSYYRLDASGGYHYSGFGVPGLGLRRGLAEELVIAPYASLLALPLAPQAVMRNIQRLRKLGMLGRYGFYEAVDYTPEHVPAGQRYAIARTYMAHHLGMSLVSLVNCLHGDVMVRRFHSDLRIQATDLLLHEQVSPIAATESPRTEELRVELKPPSAVPIEPWDVSMDAPVPQVHLLSNGEYTAVIAACGSGYSAWNGYALTRWRPDSTQHDWGTWIYAQDLSTGALWSTTCQPTHAGSRTQQVRFHAHMVEFRRRDHGISVSTEVTVPPQDDAEIRLVTITNQSSRERSLMLASYAEVALAPQEEDIRHPAFNKMRIESEYDPELNALLFRRRPRSAAEEPLYLLHMLLTEPQYEPTGAYETSRAEFLGRGRTARAPAALGPDGPRFTRTSGVTLDPVMSLGQRLDLDAGSTTRLAFVTLAAKSRQEAITAASRYRDWYRLHEAFDQARSHAELELRRLEIPSAELQRFQELLSAVICPSAALRAPQETLAANKLGQPGLWGFGISGDFPIVLARLHSEEGVLLVRELLEAHAYWHRRGMLIDLVILNEQPGDYNDEFHGQLRRLIYRVNSDEWLSQRGGVYLLHAGQMGETERVLLRTAARADLCGEDGSLSVHLARIRPRPAPLPSLIAVRPSQEGFEPAPPLERPKDLLFDNGWGGFAPDGREYVVYVQPGNPPPAPWVNVVANPEGGFLVSESGSGFSWAENSGENRLTTWHNDPVSDPPGEALYLRDEETAEVWSPTPLPAPADAPYLVRHGAGYSVFEHHSHGLKQRMRLFQVPDSAVKVVHLRLENVWERTRRVTATYYAEWVLGTSRGATQMYIVPQMEAHRRALMARNSYSTEFSGRVAFLAASKDLHGFTCDRAEFLGRRGSLAAPQALRRVGLASSTTGDDPCAALQIHLDLAAGDAEEVFFVLGEGRDREEAVDLIERYSRAESVEEAWEEARASWDRLLGQVEVRTPDGAMDVLLNRWLLYQAVSCRLWGRSALYQSGGGYGFRDQLQDVLAVLHTTPELAREHILLAASHQFEEGDVQHWWHPPSGRGVRTRYSDDLLWLPFATARYVEATDDEGVLEESIPFLRAPELGPDEVERYGHFERSSESASLYEHCLRAIERGDTAGRRGLPLMGGGDWNDGMNRVGAGGKGESVWLGWFLHANLTRFGAICQRMGDSTRGDALLERAEVLRQAVEDEAWDGEWYRRAYFDDGSPLGSSSSEECRIASMAQSWAVLSGAADPDRALCAMRSVEQELVRDDERLLLLFTPPFDQIDRDPGYIKSYPPGIRENGGQYTHAALWAVWAFAKLGMGDRAGSLFRMLNPVYRSDSPEEAEVYRVEPYVVAADVYSNVQHVGRGGWTWYTGSAGWMYQLGLEAILGIRREGKKLVVDPCVPREWASYEVDYRFGGSVYRIAVQNPEKVCLGVRSVRLDGREVAGEGIPLEDDGGEHSVEVVLG